MLRIHIGPSQQLLEDVQNMPRISHTREHAAAVTVKNVQNIEPLYTHMVTFLAGGTGTPKLLAGARDVFDQSNITVVANTGDDIELSGHLVCPDVDTVLFHEAGLLDTKRWWGIQNDSIETHEMLGKLAAANHRGEEPQYLEQSKQTGGRRISRWRRFSGLSTFMQIGDRDRGIHLYRTARIDEGATLTEVTMELATGLDIDLTILPMSNDPVATIIHTRSGPMHFQEYWVAKRADPTVTDVEFRGKETAAITQEVNSALSEPVVIGPSNPITSIGPMCALPEFVERLKSVPVVVVSPFIRESVFSGPAAELMEGVGYAPSTVGLANRYPFADAFVLDETDDTSLDRPTYQTDITLNDATDATRVVTAAQQAISDISGT